MRSGVILIKVRSRLSWRMISCAGGGRDEVREAFEGDRVALVDQIGYRLAQGRHFTHLLTSFPGAAPAGSPLSRHLVVRDMVYIWYPRPTLGLLRKRSSLPPMARSIAVSPQTARIDAPRDPLFIPLFRLSLVYIFLYPPATSRCPYSVVLSTISPIPVSSPWHISYVAFEICDTSIGLQRLRCSVVAAEVLTFPRASGRLRIVQPLLSDFAYRFGSTTCSRRSPSVSALAEASLES